MNGIRSMVALLSLLLVAAAIAMHAADPKPAAKAVTQCTAAASMSAAALQTVSQGGSPCKECPNTCDGSVRRCKDGSVKACYEAAACLCKCNLEAGGCGSDKEALRKCVEDNEKNARDMER